MKAKFTDRDKFILYHKIDRERTYTGYEFTDIDNYKLFLKIKKKANTGHEGAMKLYKMMEKKYSQMKWVTLYRQWLIIDLSKRANNGNIIAYLKLEKVKENKRIY